MSTSELMLVHFIIEKAGKNIDIKMTKQPFII